MVPHGSVPQHFAEHLQYGLYVSIEFIIQFVDEVKPSSITSWGVELFSFNFFINQYVNQLETVDWMFNKGAERDGLVILKYLFHKHLAHFCTQHSKALQCTHLRYPVFTLKLTASSQPNTNGRESEPLHNNLAKALYALGSPLHAFAKNHSNSRNSNWNHTHWLKTLLHFSHHCPKIFFSAPHFTSCRGVGKRPVWNKKKKDSYQQKAKLKHNIQGLTIVSL